MKQLFITVFNPEHEELFSDFISHIDAVDSHTIIYHKTNYSEADVLRLYYDLNYIYIAEGKVILYFKGGLYAEIIRKSKNG